MKDLNETTVKSERIDRGRVVNSKVNESFILVTFFFNYF